MTDHARTPTDIANDDFAALERAARDGVRQGDPRERLRDAVQIVHEIDPQTDAMRRIGQKLTAGAIECQILARARILHALWPDAQTALAHRTIARQVIGIPDADIERAGEMLAETVMRAVNEAPEVIPGFDASSWDPVLIELLAPEGD